MGKAIALLIVAIVAAVVVWQLIGQPPPEPVSVPGAAPVAGEVPVDRVSVAATAPTEPAGTARTSVVLDEPDPLVVTDDRKPAGRTGVRIEVSHADGQPAAGIPLVVLSRRDGVHVHWRGDSDAAGRADAEWTAEFVDPDAGGEVFVALPMAERLGVRVDLSSPPVEPIQLSLPPLGAVDVVLEHPDPARLVDATVHLRGVEVAPLHGLHWFDPEREVEDGRASFEHVGVGQRLRLRAELTGGNVSREMDVDGPLAAGQRILVRMPLIGDAPVVVAELRDEGGELLRSVSVDARLRARHEGSSLSSMFSTESSADGRLYLTFEDGLGKSAERSLQLVLEGTPARMVEVELPELLPGENDIGVLTLRAPPLACGGRVVDRSGAGIANATVALRRKHVYDASREDGFYWVDSDLPEAQTEADGRFAIEGTLDAGEYAAVVRCAGYLPLDSAPIIAGTRSLEFVLASAAKLRGRVLFGDVWEPRAFYVEVVRGAEVERADIPRDGEYSFDELASGDVTLRVRTFGDPKPLFERLLRVDAGVETVVEDIDLAGSLRKISFRVVDSAGRPVADAAALLLHDGSESSRYEGLFLDAGHGVVITRGGAVSVVAYADGYRNVRASAVRDGDELVMTPACEVLVRLAPPVALPAGTQLDVVLQPRDPSFGNDAEVVIRGEGRTSSMSGGGAPWTRGATGSIGADGVARLLIAEPGAYSVRLLLRRADGRGRRASIGGETSVRVGQADSRLTVDVAVRSEELEAAATAVRGG